MAYGLKASSCDPLKRKGKAAGWVSAHNTCLASMQLPVAVCEFGFTGSIPVFNTFLPALRLPPTSKSSYVWSLKTYPTLGIGELLV